MGAEEGLELLIASLPREIVAILQCCGDLSLKSEPDVIVQAIGSNVQTPATGKGETDNWAATRRFKRQQRGCPVFHEGADRRILYLVTQGLRMTGNQLRHAISNEPAIL
jgi:hypothetical protein